MFRRGGGGGGGGGKRNNGERRYNEHDNRGHERRVSFREGSKMHPNRMRRKNNMDISNIVKNLQIQDDDVNMFGSDSTKMTRRDFRRPGGPKSNNYVPAKLMQGTSPWYQVTIPYGKQHEKTFLLNTLLKAMAPDVFVPYFYSFSGNAVIFYVDEYSTAEKLNKLDRKIGMPNGFKLGVKVRNGTPNVYIDDDVLEKMKLAMAGRYNPNTKALDLTKFYADPALEGVFCALFRPTIMLAAINIMSTNIPDLQALNLNDNKLHVLDHFKSLLKKLPNLKILYLGNNRIPHVNSLEPLKGIPLIELVLEGNPLADRFKEKEAYVREVRKRFPKVTRLDGVDLPPLIGFDVSDDINLPSKKASYLCNAEGSVIVRQFLEQYFAIYDSESRQPLLDAYHENAVFSMSSWYGTGGGQGSNNKLQQYFANGRNLLRISDYDARKKNLKYGRLQVVSLLNDLPKTQHDPLSFCVDMTICTPNLIMLTVNGVFKETSTSTTSKSTSGSLIRAFHKTMIIVPYGGGFCIKNDMMHVTTATAEQEENSFKPPGIVNSPQPPAYASPQPTPVVSPVSSPSAPDTQQQMIQALCMQTNMNMEWSRICLEQTNWEYQRAVLVFNSLNSEGKIPPEAFLK